MLDTRDLQTERDDLKQEILDDFNDNFNTEFDDFDEIILERLDSEDFEYIDREAIEEFKAYWADEYVNIEAINELEDEVGSEWEYGVTLIEENEFEDYCEEFCEDVGYISRDMPYLIRNNIDFKGIAEDMKQDYSELEYQGRNYLFRE